MIESMLSKLRINVGFRENEGYITLLFSLALQQMQMEPVMNVQS